MPNYCENDLFIWGLTADLRRFISGLKRDGEGKFSILGSYDPMPEELMKTSSPSRIVESQEEKDSIEKAEDEFSTFVRSYPITRAESQALIEKYGADNWHDWRLENWNTKWGDFEDKISEPLEEDYDDDDRQHVLIAFRTARRPPNMAKVFSKFPELEFSLYSYERGCEFQAGQEWKNGELTDEWHHAYHGTRGG